MKFRRTDNGTFVAQTSRMGMELVRSPLLNRGSAFTPELRAERALEGLLPPGINTLDQQVRRAHRAITRKSDPLERYIGLRALQDRNETLFYRLLVSDLKEFLPIVYTPTVGEGCRLYSQILRSPRGVWITPDHRGRIADVLGNLVSQQPIRLIVVTDNERILGLGDQGVGGMGIPVGKLSLYTAAAGIHPTMTLPISLDVGTDNQELLADDLYVGWRKPRLRGDAYFELVEEFVGAVKQVFPEALLQWEDFKKANAFTLLDRYRESLPSFNDDIQGTASVALAAVMAAGEVAGTALRDQRVVILGAGAAGIGIGRQLRSALAAAGLSGEALTAAIAVIDSRGLLVADREFRDGYKREFAWPVELASARGLGDGSARDLLGVVDALEPTVLIGTSGTAGAFTEDVVRRMAKSCARPAVFPMSNPTSKAEAKPVDIVAWTDGAAIIASGSPFDAVPHAGRSIPVTQGNNAYVFPGIGLGMLVSGAGVVTDAMFTAAAHALSALRPTAGTNGDAPLFPPVTELRAVTARVAEAVVRQARDEGQAPRLAGTGDDDIAAAVAAEMWDPEYPDLERPS